MPEILLDKSCINTVISENPFVKLLSVPKYNEIENRWECLAQVMDMFAFIEVKLTELENK